MSQQFHIGSPPFTDITEKQGIPFNSSFGTALLKDKDNEKTIFLFGGYTSDNSTKFEISTLDVKSGNRNRPVTSGKVPERRLSIQGVIDDLGKIYIFGGANFNGTSYFNDMIILNTNDLTWSYGPTFNTLLKKMAYTATLLSNGMIVYIGGQELTDGGQVREVDINQISLYNTTSNTWKVEVCMIVIVTFFMKFSFTI